MLTNYITPEIWIETLLFFQKDASSTIAEKWSHKCLKLAKVGNAITMKELTLVG